MITTPSGCLKTGTGSLLSKKILFVAMARTLGIPARLNPHDRSMEYMKNGKFIPVSAETEKKASILLKASADTQWKYFQNWSIAKLEAGKFQRSGDEAAAGSGKLQDPYLKQIAKWKYICSGVLF